MIFYSDQKYLIKPSSFQPYQFVCLEHQATRLYAEVVQVAESRPVCWVRPRMLIHLHQPETTQVHSPASYSDLRNGADLLCPIALLRVALDSEILPWLAIEAAQMEGCNFDPDSNLQLKQFFQSVWQAYPDAF